MNSRDRYDSLLRYYAAKYDLDWLWLKAQMLVESSADPMARSEAGARGLMQFMPDTWREVMVDADPHNPELSIWAGARYMRQLMNRYGNDLPLALAAYNWGLGHLDRVLAQHPRDWHAFLPDETKDYLRHITTLQKGGLATAAA